MELAQRLSTCKQCEKRKFDPNTGLVCSLTLRKPEFDNDCSEFVIDPKEFAKKNARSYAADVESNSTSSGSVWGTIAIILVIIRIVWRFVRD